MNAGRTPTRFRSLRSESGLSLMELLVTMVMAGVIGTTAVLGITTLTRYQTAVEAREQAQQQAQLAVDQIASQVRSGNVLYQPTETSTAWGLLLYTQANGDQKCVEWDLVKNTQELRSRSWVPTWDDNGFIDPGEVADWRTVATGLINGTLSPPISPFTVPPDAPFGERLLTVDLRVGVDGNVPNGLPVSTSVTGRNTQYNYGTDLCGAKP